MITRSQDINSIRQEFLNDERRDTKPARGILAVGDHQLHISFRRQTTGVCGNHRPTRRCEDVSDE